MLTPIRTLLIPLLSAAVLSLGACASAPPPAEVQASLPPGIGPEDNPTAYGEFLAGSVALHQGQARAASAYFERGAALGPETVLLKEQAFVAALEGGDVHRAAMLAPELDVGSVDNQRLGRLTRAVDAMADKRPREAEALLAGDQIGAPHRAAAVLLRPWAAAAAGDWKTALTPPDAQGDRLVEAIGSLDLALLLERRRRYDDAEALFKKLSPDGAGGGPFSIAYGEFLERRGRSADAMARYDAMLKDDSSNEAARAARARIAAGGPAPPATFAGGAGQALFLGPTFEFLSRKQVDSGLIYLRLVLRLDPGRDQAWLMLGEILAAIGQKDAAREAYGHPQPGSPEFVAARAQLVATYDQPADDALKLQIVQDTAKASPDDRVAMMLLADELRVNQRYAEAAAVLDRFIARQGDNADWLLYYMRGASLAEANQWQAAEADLTRALAMQPDQPDVLNYLGFSWIDRGVRLQEAKAMLEKAVAAAPDSGAIVDSLGWAYYKLGDYPHAVEQLERAAELDAGDPDVNDHLGDAYWKAGRSIEARFQWNAVLTMEPSAKRRSEVEEKLKAHPPETADASRTAPASVVAR